MMTSESSLSLGSVPQTPTTASAFKGPNPFSSKVTTVLATSYADSEFRGALSLIDDRGHTNSAATRRQVRLQLQKEVIDSNGNIIVEFGRVADVRPPRQLSASSRSYAPPNQPVVSSNCAE